MAKLNRNKIFFFLVVAVLVGANLILGRVGGAMFQEYFREESKIKKLHWEYNHEEAIKFADSVQLCNTVRVMDSLYQTDGEEACRKMVEENFEKHNYGLRLKYFSDKKGGDSLLDLIDSMAIVLSH